jgi:dihydroorotate dehydrogenase (NAD+) catalytic subunit
MVLDPETGRPVLGAGGGGYSGRPLHAVAVRTVHDVHAALPDLPIVGVGGVSNGWDAAELLLAGASAVQVGTATFADPAAPSLVQRDLLAWCAARGVTPASLRGLAHCGGLHAARQSR